MQQRPNLEVTVHVRHLVTRYRPFSRGLVPGLVILASVLGVRNLDAQDCGVADTTIFLQSQSDVDNFQADHGPCSRVLGWLQIEPAAAPITDLSPLEDVVEIEGGLLVEGSFSNLMGLHNLNSVGRTFTIEGASTPVTDLTGLDSLTSADVLYLNALYSLNSLAGAPNLSTIRRLRLSDLPALPNLSGLPAVMNVQDLDISLTGMTSLNGAPVMSSLESLRLDSMSLSDLGGLAASTFVSDPPDEASLEISFISTLTNLTGLPIGEKFGSIQIYNNSDLTSLAGLENLVEAWSTLHVYDNDKLADCSTLATVLDDVDDGDPGPGDGSNPDDPPDTSGLEYIRIENNGDEIGPEAQCNSIEEIVASGETDVILEDGFESETL